MPLVPAFQRLRQEDHIHLEIWDQLGLPRETQTNHIQQKFENARSKTKPNKQTETSKTGDYNRPVGRGQKELDFHTSVSLEVATSKQWQMTTGVLSSWLATNHTSPWKWSCLCFDLLPARWPSRIFLLKNHFLDTNSIQDPFAPSGMVNPQCFESTVTLYWAVRCFCREVTKAYTLT